MSSLRKTSLPSLERKASLRDRASESKVQESSEAPPNPHKPQIKASSRVPKRKGTLALVNLTAEAEPIPGRVEAYRPLLPMPGNAAAPSNTYETMANTPSSSDSVPTKRRKINHDPLLSLKSSATASASLSAMSMTSATAKPTTERTRNAKYNQQATARSHIKTSKSEHKNRVNVTSGNLSMNSRDLEIPPSNDSMSDGEQSEEPLDK